MFIRIGNVPKAQADSVESDWRAAELLGELALPTTHASAMASLRSNAQRETMSLSKLIVS